MISSAAINAMNGTSKREKAENLLHFLIFSVGANNNVMMKGNIGSATAEDGQGNDKNDADALAKIAIGKLHSILGETRKSRKGKKQR